MTDAREVIANVYVWEDRKICEAVADAILAALAAAGLKVVGPGFTDAVRQARCPSDGRGLVGECFDDKACGCTIGIYLAAPPSPTQGEKK